MASAGRILIIPRGDWNAETTYESLDLVFYEGTSWLAKKNVVGVAPTEDNAEHWFKMCESKDLTEIYNRLQALEGAMVSQVDIDFTPYAKVSDVSAMNTRLSGVESGLADVSAVVSGLSTNGVKIATGSYTGNGYSGSSGKTSITFDFEPKVVFLQDSQFKFSCPVIWHKGLPMLTLGLNGSNTTKQLQFEQNGNTLSWYYPLQEPDTQLNNSGTVYHWVAIG